MKNIRSFNLSANRCTGLLILILILCLGMITGCKKKKDDSPGPGSQPYYNMSDTSTRQIIASIPRIELSRLKSTMVNLYLSVTDQDGKPFTDFNQYNFFIKQICVGSKDTAMVASGSFSKLNETGSNIATPLVLDYSGSMTNYIGDLEQAAGKFTVIKNGSDQVELIKFSSTIENIHPFTSDTTALLQALRSQWVYAGNNTAFYNAMALGLNDADTFINSNFPFVPAVIGFTDGIDNESTITLPDLITASLNKQIPLYTLGFGSADEYLLNAMSTQTGGRYYYAPDISTLQNLFSLISGQLKNLYRVSWVYDNPACPQVLMIVEVNYTCKNGSFTAKTEKIFSPLVK